MQLRNAILLFGIVNASLYSALLPLWEGFDEAFHYAYVETLWQTKRLPVLGRTPIPNDVAQSLRLAPVSPVVARSLPESTAFDTWLALPQAEKERRRSELEELRPQPLNGSRPNYQAHHPPLSYLLLAPLDWAMSKAPITVRVLTLRIFTAVLCTVLVWLGAVALCRVVQLPERFANAALFTIFCSQMLYATIAHVANDGLAIGIGALFLAALARFMQEPGWRSTLGSALWLAAGLLTKAYFLAFVPLAIAVAAWQIWRGRARVKTVLAGAALVLVLAGPWYIRNLVLYRNVSGTHEEFDGIGVRQALAAAPRIDWVATTGFLARGSLWTGNNSFTTFSRTTLNIILALLFAAAVVWAIRVRASQPAERMIFAAILLFSLAVAYATCATFADTHGQAAGARPWYTQVLLAPVLTLVCAGLSRCRKSGGVLAAIVVASWTWVLIGGWTAKLFPMYSGAGAAPMRMRDVRNWYVHGAAAHTRDFSLLALGPAPLLYAGLVVAVVLSILLGFIIIRNLTSPVRVDTTA